MEGAGEGWDGNRSRGRRLQVSNIPQDLLKQCCKIKQDKSKIQCCDSEE